MSTDACSWLSPSFVPWDGNGVTWTLRRCSEEPRGRLSACIVPWGPQCVPRMDTEPLQVTGAQRYLVNSDLKGWGEARMMLTSHREDPHSGPEDRT